MKFLEASISTNNKRMDESDVSASVASPTDYIPYFSFALDHHTTIVCKHLPSMVDTGHLGKCAFNPSAAIHRTLLK